jgi:hypothetical protein
MKTKQEQLESLKTRIKTIEYQLGRIKRRVETIKIQYPLTAETVDTLTESQEEKFDSALYRFSQVQHLMVSKVFPLFLEVAGEPVEDFTFIDKLNYLERMKVLSAGEWIGLRKLRNEIAQDYEEGDTDRHVRILNAFLNGVPVLEGALHCIKQRIMQF